MGSGALSDFRKLSGAFYTPDAVARTLVRWVVRSGADHLIDPACGDGRFIRLHENSVGVERDAGAAELARSMAGAATVHCGDFFEWADTAGERFDCAVGNPPFIRYQSFSGETRRRAQALCLRSGVRFSGLTSSWTPFIVAVTGLLKLDGRIAFVVPAEIGHAPYAAPLVEHLAASFRRVAVIAVREKLFPELSEDCWLLYADGHGGSTDEIEFTALERFAPLSRPPQPGTKVGLGDWRSMWGGRLRPLLMPVEARTAYREASLDSQSFRLSDAAAIGIGYVSGANDFFHLRPSEALRLDIPDRLLLPTVRSSRFFPTGALTPQALSNWRKEDAACLLLKLPADLKPPAAVERYLRSPKGLQASRAYKCRTRTPWWSVPDVRIPDYFLSYMSGRSPVLVANRAGATCANSVHALRVKETVLMQRASRLWGKRFVQLSCEVEGHPLGGGMLKLEVREAGRVLFPAARLKSLLSAKMIDEALWIMRRWRHCGDRT